MKFYALLSLLFLFAQESKSQSLIELYQKVNTSVVIIETQSNTTDETGKKRWTSTESSQGSGVLISEDGLIWTASHVVNSADYVAVKFNDNDIYMAKVISTNPQADVALIKIQGPFHLGKKHVAIIGDSDSTQIGEDIFVIGAPHGLEQSLSKGIVSGRMEQGVNSNFSTVEFIQTDAAINPGNSGGPIFNMKGEVIAIASFILSEDGGFNGIGFGATSNIAEKLLMDSKALWVGIEFIFLDEEMAQVFNVPTNGGLLVLSVAIDGLGGQIGLQGGFLESRIMGVDLLIGGDIITEVAGIVLNNKEAGTDLHKKLKSFKSGDQYEVKFLRKGKIISKIIKVK